jgi:hypothetical protein
MSLESKPTPPYLLGTGLVGKRHAFPVLAVPILAGDTRRSNMGNGQELKLD